MNWVTKFSTQVGTIHFIGIGGIGMSGIAEVLLNLGYSVQGSDINDTKITRRLNSLGARIFLGHFQDNVMGSAAIVVSSAISPDNPELKRARELGIPIVRRAEMLAELMRFRSNIAIAGTHGKTTTTTLVATLLEKGGFDPTVINGGIIRAYGSNARKGEGDWMVVEADESDGTFLKLPATIAIVTNIDPEHMDHYGSFDNLRHAFESFVSNIPFYGFAVCCIDHPEVQAMVGRITDRRIITYGVTNQADIQFRSLGFENGLSNFEVNFNLDGGSRGLFQLPMVGEHNVSNAVSAITVAWQLGMTIESIASALREFRGVNRRFTQMGIVNDVEIVDDYGHHPVEIRAVLKAARQKTKGQIIAIHQPHRFTRLKNLFNEFCRCFNQADLVVITDVYAAGETSLKGTSKESLVEGLIQHGHKNAMTTRGLDELAEIIGTTANPGDIVIFLGAGNISEWAKAFPDLLLEKGAR
ncbi:MAG: UDP-N-acetylmuramate--L-alanine ligase [Rhodobacteraceae bacterium]|nr:UDP-N-acetylmuramate--L-alanine ligase [Paracoccaceae bacterium]MCY4250355.1 UDP-N-acetylmuramate--L-alanine ligase [Paracoccaceae bacterium]